MVSRRLLSSLRRTPARSASRQWSTYSTGSVHIVRPSCSLMQAVTSKHFRPKAFVKPPTGRRVCGYYWLAGEIRNLLLACSNCNSRKRQSHRGVSAIVMSGKGNEFPLADEANAGLAPVKKQESLHCSSTPTSIGQRPSSALMRTAWLRLAAYGVGL